MKFKLNWELILTLLVGISAWKTWKFIGQTEFVSDPDVFQILGTGLVVSWAVASTAVFFIGAIELLFVAKKDND